MMNFDRGDVVLANLNPIVGTKQAGQSRPCVVVSPGQLNRVFHGVVICPITDARHKKHPGLGLIRVPAGEGGLHKNSYVISFQVRMIDKKRIIQTIGSFDEPIMNEISDTLKFVLGMRN
ncbi:MAG: type II toxin-antitoxin system PemK/MazF family toxin [Candidatus Electryonea clarkiae]|nr:type II toxin-antitoxin system PemK/MazF family toxin [Candidatus Electryonea clarkiae]MDP8288206.1 type II toxin-antitoxin system PemK/MazF family toxin [Candidatus Electryonea clarkiae]